MSDIIRMKKSIFENVVEKISLISQIKDANKHEVAKSMYDAYKNAIEYENDTVEDFLEEITNVENGLYGTYLDKPSLCIKKGEEVLAGLFVTDFKGDATLTYTFTKEEYQNLGMAIDLIKTSENILVKLGYSELYLYLNLANIPAFNLFESLGFEEVSID